MPREDCTAGDPRLFIAPSASRGIAARGNGSEGHPGAAAWARVRAAFALRLGVDTRALAALRVLLGVLLLVDLLYRSLGLTTFYTDAGAVPRSVLTGFWSGYALHSLSGAAWFQGALFFVQGIVALALLVGYRTRLATGLSLLLLLSLHLRNPFILNAGDVLLRVLLFWGLFLPLGARWSVDALRHGAMQARVADVATTALLLQVVIIYGLNAYHKIQGGQWGNGEALQYIFLNERYMTSLGLAMNHFPSLLALLGKTWLGLLLIAPLLLVLTGRPRMILVGLFAAAHLGMFASMQLGLFPLVSLVALLPFLPAPAWDFAERRVVAPVASSTFVQRIARIHTAPAAGAGPRRGNVTRWLLGARTAVAVPFLAWLVVSTAVTTGLLVFPAEIQSELEARERRWAMFAVPGQANSWIVAPATLESGRSVDALHGGEASWEEPRYVESPYPDFRWRKFLDALKRPDRDDLLVAFATHLCTRWNATHDDEIVQLVIYRVDQRIHLTGPDPPAVRSELKAHDCAS